MSLVSNLFLLFVAVSVLVYYIVPHKFQWLVLLCFSYIYYLAGGVRYVGFILFSTLVTWGIALAVEKAEAGGSHKSARNFSGAWINIEFWYAWSDKVYKFYD